MPRTEQQVFAGVAHQLACQAAALRELGRCIGQGMSGEEVQQLIALKVADLEARLELNAAVGHAVTGAIHV
jgi:hypothetical protein